MIASRLYRPGHGPLTRYFRNWRDSGALFAFYLSYVFFYAPLLTRAMAPFMRKPVTLERLCHELGVDYALTDDVNEPRIRDALAARGVRRLVSCYFDQILGDALIAACPEGCLNLHPGRLPEYRGLFPEFHAAAEGGPFGYAIHCITDTGVDTGPLIETGTVTVPGEADLLCVSRRVLEAGTEALGRVVADWDTAVSRAVPQHGGRYHSYPDRLTMRRLRDSGRSVLNWRTVQADLRQFARARTDH